LSNHVSHKLIDGVECKRCADCGEYKPLNNFIRDSQKKDGLCPYCFGCRKVKKEVDYKKHKDAYLKRAKKYYADNHEVQLEKNQKRREQNRDSIYATNKIWRDTHKKEKALMDKVYREANKEKIKERLRQYSKSQEFKEGHKLRNQKYLKTENGLLSKQLSRQRYRNRSKEVSATLTKIQWKACKQFFHYSCAYCGKPLKNLTQDHFIPLKDGGGYDVNNIIPCCKPCNSGKQSQDFFLWYPKQEFFNEQRKAKILEYLALF